MNGPIFQIKNLHQALAEDCCLSWRSPLKTGNVACLTGVVFFWKASQGSLEWRCEQSSRSTHFRTPAFQEGQSWKKSGWNSSVTDVQEWGVATASNHFGCLPTRIRKIHLSPDWPEKKCMDCFQWGCRPGPWPKGNFQWRFMNELAWGAVNETLLQYWPPKIIASSRRFQSISI